MMNSPAPNCSCLRLRAEQALIDASSEELEKAHAIIRILLNGLTPTAKRDAAYHIAVAGLEGEGVTRANEREALLKRLATARAGRGAAPILYPQEQVAAAALLASRDGYHLLAQDLAAISPAISDLADAATAVLASSRDESPERTRLHAAVLRFGARPVASMEASP